MEGTGQEEVKDTTDYVKSGGELELSLPGEKLYSLSQATEEAFNKRTLYTSGLTLIDQYLGGYEAGELVTFAADQGVGKSTLCLYSALRAASKGVNVAYVSLEDSVRRVGARALCLTAGLDDRKVRLHAAGMYSFSVEEKAKLKKAREIIKGYELQVVHPKRCTAASVLQAAAQASEAGARTIIVDYVQRISFGGSGESPWQSINEFLFEFESLAQQKNFVPVIVSQLHATQGDGASRLKGSKVIADVSRLMLVASRVNGILTVRCEKSTDGAPPFIQRFIRKNGVFMEYKEGS